MKDEGGNLKPETGEWNRAEQDRLERSDSRGAGSPEGEIKPESGDRKGGMLKAYRLKNLKLLLQEAADATPCSVACWLPAPCPKFLAPRPMLHAPRSLPQAPRSQLLKLLLRRLPMHFI